MAYMSQEKKAVIAAELKKVIPHDWKYSLRVQHHSSLTLSIMEAPVDLFNLHKQHDNWTNGYIQLNEYYLETQYEGEVLDTLKKIRTALNTGNHSDVQTDYFDVGFYAYIHIGRWDKPFRCTAKKELTYEEMKARITALESTKILKRAIKREPSIPVGELSPLYLDCECGHHLPIRSPKQDCICGKTYDSRGYILEKQV